MGERSKLELRCLGMGSPDTSSPSPRATFLSLYRWPESDAEFVRSVRNVVRSRSEQRPRRLHVKVVDSYSCRQMYLRSYTFTKKQSLAEKAKNCVVKARDKLAGGISGGGGFESGEKWPSKVVVVVVVPIFAALRRLLVCCLHGADGRATQVKFSRDAW